MNPLSSYMKLLSAVSARILLAGAVCASPLSAIAQDANEPVKLIESIIAPQQMDDLGPGNLRDGRADTKYHTWNEDDEHGRFWGDQYLEVTLTNPLKLEADEDIVVFIQRCNDCDNRQPTVFKVMGSESDNPGVSDWEDFCRIYFLYRGKSTKEYSARIHTEKKYKKLRFYVIDNNTRSYDSAGHHSMGLSEFEIYKVKRGGNYPYPMSDQFHLRDDYKRDYEDYKFIKTMGWLDERNRSLEKTSDNRPAYEQDMANPTYANEKVNNEAYSKGEKSVQEGYINKLRDWAKWNEDWGANGEWNLDQDALLELGVEMPSLAPITNDQDFDPKANMKCQPTHVTEHILYALPGDPIILIPYGNFAGAKHFEKYEVNFAHWYDYRTGDKIVYDDGKGNVTNLLDFLADPWGICTSNTDGFYGAYLLSEKKKNPTDLRPYIPNTLQAQNYGMSATFFCPRNPFIENGVAHSLPFRDCDQAKPNNDIDLNEFVIAADFSQSFNKGRNIDDAGEEKSIIEPNIAFRHIFRIRDGKAFADDFSGSKKDNENYINRNRREVTARANNTFQIGLDISVPMPWVVGDNKWRSVPSEYYYKISDSEYRRIDAMRIRVTRPDGTKIADLTNEQSRTADKDNIFYFGEFYDGVGSRTYEDITYYIGGRRTQMWDPNNHNEEGKYFRMLKSDKTDLHGKYKVEIIGQEIIGEKEPSDIIVYGSTSEDDKLVVMEFEIDFVDNEESGNPKAILVNSDRLHSNDKFKYAREEEMIESWGKPKDRIDFDYYRGLETLSTKDQYLYEKATDSKRYKFKWPAAWQKSQYANGYSNDHNYNMYVVANHSSVTPYHNHWHNDENNNHSDTEYGLYDRLNDKTTRLKAVDNSVEVENGYFLYVNAASDPGVMVTLNVDNLCTGSTVHVSAWVADFSRLLPDNKVYERANIVFNFVAVLTNGDRINLHSFVSGYIPDDQTGKWMNINYSFTPDVNHIGYTASQIDHYELELENNCKSSEGADYAIDDISVYIVSPVVVAEQESPLCTDVAEGEENLVKIEIPFTETLQSIDVEESTSAEKGEGLKLQYVILDREKFDEEYEKALKSGDENPGMTAYKAAEVKIGIGSVDFNSYPGNNPDYNTIKEDNKAGLLTNDRNVRMIAFKTNFEDTQFKVGKEYYLSLYVSKTKDAITADWTQFDITDPCAKYCIFKVKSKNNIRIDGEVRGQDGEISVCEGEAPIISVDIATEDDSKEYFSANCDWFLGTREEYDATEEGEMSLYKAMTYFREVYPEVSSPEAVEAKDGFTEEMRQYILSHTDKLIFYSKTYQFPAIKIPEGENTAEDVVLVLPIPAPEDGNVTVCTAPMEIHIYADMHSPKLLHGLREGITYPDDMEDAPLRIGLEQLSQVTLDDKAAATEENALLVIPIRTVESSGVVSEVKAMSKKSDILLLESTTDPNYDMEPKPMTSESGETYVVFPEYEAGRICSFKAQINGNENALGAVFFKDFIFREGYEYTFSYAFKEAVAADTDVKLCDGRTHFTIKVVPEFLMWTPDGESRNWNNDGNWKRISTTDLKAELNDGAVPTRLSDKVTNGSNSNEGAFMPMDFTKVIIPATCATAKAPFMYEWGVENATAGAATDRIEYDMVAKETGGNVECERWYANTCDQIHFLTDASIMNQQHLKYGKAWVDLELTPYRWYTLAMPLKKVFAGEFYLPTATARQSTELFQEIKYDENLNDRFNPAVFQRGWDKGKADIYHPDGSTSTAIVSANWSHVYNDVEESYGSGVGFSIKADVSSVASNPDKVLFRLPKADEEYGYYDVEGDDHNLAYKPINHGDDHYRLNEANGTITATTAGTATGDGKRYFLVGNPFMTHLDMKAFLEANSSKVEQKYWMITEGTQKMGVFDPEDKSGLVGNAEGYVAPMQGFFVEAKTDANSLVLSYDKSMMYDASGEGVNAPLKVAARGYDEGFTLTISAINDDEESTAAVVRVAPDASGDYIAEEDMVVIDNSDLEIRATVYTVSDGKALSVNSLDGIGNVELGLIALPEEETVLRFNLDNDCSLNLYDAETGAYTPVFDGMTYPVSGNVAGRLYLTASSGVKTVEASRLTWSTSGDELTVRSSDTGCSHLSVRIIDYAGRVVAARSVDGCEVTLPIAAGVYVLEAETETERICLQVKI